MSGQYHTLYKTNSEPDAAYFLEKGHVYFYASAVDKYAINGNKLVVGATEVILKHLKNEDILRLETTATSEGTELKRIPADKFISNMNSFSFALNVAMVLAKQVLLTNGILEQNLKELKDDVNELKDTSISYFRTVDSIQEQYSKLRFPWLKNIAEKYSQTLTFKRGEAYFKSSKPVILRSIHALSDSNVEFSRDTVICKEGTQGNEMYVLHSGTIDVQIKGESVALIEEEGVVFGEMALLLNQPRSATLVAKNSAILTPIKKNDLKSITEKEPDFISSIAQSLAARHYYNLIKIESTNKAILEKKLSKEESDAVQRVSVTNKARKELYALKDEIETAYKEKKESFLKELLTKF